MRRWPNALATVLHKLSKDRSGAAAVEFALMIPIFLMLVLTVLYFGFTYYVASRMERAAFQAQELIRYPEKRPQSVAQVRSIICGSLGGLVECSRLIVQVAPLSQVPVGSGSPETSSYSVIPDQPAILRVVSPPSPLVLTLTSFLRLNPASLEVNANVFFHVRS